MILCMCEELCKDRDGEGSRAYYIYHGKTSCDIREISTSNAASALISPTNNTNGNIFDGKIVDLTHSVNFIYKGRHPGS